MSGIDTTVTLHWAITKKCPFRDELDAGDLVITVAEDAPELHNLAAAIWKLTAEPVTHEDFTRSVAMLLPPGSEVVTSWHTGPFGVTVTCRVLAQADAGQAEGGMTEGTPDEMNVAEIPRPWEHEWGTVVDIEYPREQPRLVNLVFGNSELKGVETRTAVYVRQPDGRWKFARLATGPEGEQP